MPLVDISYCNEWILDQNLLVPTEYSISQLLCIAMLFAGPVCHSGIGGWYQKIIFVERVCMIRGILKFIVRFSFIVSSKTLYTAL